VNCARRPGESSQSGGGGREEGEEAERRRRLPDHDEVLAGAEMTEGGDGELGGGGEVAGLLSWWTWGLLSLVDVEAAPRLQVSGGSEG